MATFGEIVRNGNTSRSSRFLARAAPSGRPTAMCSPPPWSGWRSRPTPILLDDPELFARAAAPLLGVDGDEFVRAARRWAADGVVG